MYFVFISGFNFRIFVIVTDRKHASTYYLDEVSSGLASMEYSFQFWGVGVVVKKKHVTDDVTAVSLPCTNCIHLLNLSAQ